MGKIKELIIETEEAGYDTEKMSIQEMLEVRESGRIADFQRESECNLAALFDKTEQEWKYIEMCKAEHGAI